PQGSWWNGRSNSFDLTGNNYRSRGPQRECRRRITGCCLVRRRMSRIGKKSIEIPEKVRMAVSEDGSIQVEGPKGKLQWVLPRQIKIRVDGKQAVLNREAETRSVKALHGLSRSLLNNMVVGVTKGFQKTLEIHGVGFRA